MKIKTQLMTVYYEDPSEFGTSYTKLYAVGWRIAGFELLENNTFNVTYGLIFDEEESNNVA